MEKKLAIKGHSTRGKEVIELLKMMGGDNIYSHWNGDQENMRYFINGQGNIDNGCLMANRINCEDFTLEEFLEKYPFKVGDKVVYTKFGDNCDDYPVTIESMKWTGTTIEYTFNDCVTCLAKDLRMWNEELNEVISGIYLNSCDYADEVELYLGDYEIEVRDGRTYAVKKKPKYPKTYEECFNVHTDQSVLSILANKTDALYNLIICRYAYWKIAGEEMGLGKPWEPDLENEELYCIQNYNKQITISRTNTAFNKILIFPSEEMRDVFYENFKDLIEECKELL